MKNLLLLFWKNKILLLLLILAVVYLFYRLVVRNEEVVLIPKTSPTPTPITATFKSFLAEPNTREEVEKKLGKPKKEEEKEFGILSYYSSNSPNRDNQVIYKEGKVVVAKEVVTTKDNKKMKDLINLYGDPENALYNETSHDSGFNLYVYPKEGVAAYANEGDGTIIELWYFEPTSIEEFQSKWATDFFFKIPTPAEGRY